MRIFSFLIPIFFLVFGLFVFSYPMLFDANLLPGTLENNRFINYVLEHQYLWLKQDEIHKHFWTMPIFHPYELNLMYGDFLLGGMAIYSPIRFFVKNPQSAFQIFYIMVCAINFVVYYCFAKKIFKLNDLYSSFAGFMFAFCLPRSVQTNHIELFLQFYMVLSIFSFCAISETNPKIKNNFLFFLGTLFFIIQAYTTFCFGWYMLLMIPVGIFSCLIFKNSRTVFLNWYKNINKNCIWIIIFAIIALLPFCYFYLVNIVNIENNNSANLIHLLFSQSLLDSMFLNLTYFFEAKNVIGIGFFATFLFVSATFKSKFKWTIIFFTLGIIFIFADENIYLFFKKYFMTYALIGKPQYYIFALMIIIPVVLANYLKNRKSFIAGMIMMFLIVFEQIPYVHYFYWNKIEHNDRVAKVSQNRECDVLSYKFRKDENYNVKNIDTMWSANKNKKYLSNGYSNFIPETFDSILDKKCIINVK